MSTHSAPRPPSETSLREAALRHLARYAATQAQLLRVLERRIDRWLTTRRAESEDDTLPARAEDARKAARQVVAALAASGVVDDAAYAAGRARSLLRSGKSAPAVARHLALRGIAGDTVRSVLPPDQARELASALLLARRRRLGAFAPAPADAAGYRKALGIFARAGFDQATARAALAASPEMAEAAIEAVRRR